MFIATTLGMSTPECKDTFGSHDNTRNARAGECGGYYMLCVGTSMTNTVVGIMFTWLAHDSEART